MRALAILVGAIFAIAGSYAAYGAIRAVGPHDRTGDFGFGDAALAPPGGGTLLETKNFKLVLAALHRELGDEARLQSLDVKWTEANAVAQVGNSLRFVDIDASGRSQSRDNGEVTPGARMPLNRLDAAAIDKLVKAAQKQNSAPVESISLSGNSREWNIDMVRGEPDSLIANLDGSGVRLSGEPNPEPIGASPDSMLRTENLKQVLAAARKEGDRVVSLDVRPERVSISLEAGPTRELSLDYGYDAQLTSRDVRTRSGIEQGSVSFEQIDATAPERLAKNARKVGTAGLGEVQYVLLSMPTLDGQKPGLTMYFTDGNKPPYVFADLHGRHVTWPGR